MSRKVRYPASSIDKGIELSLCNSQSILDKARILLKERDIKYSFILYTFALEEYGKAVLLREQKMKHSNDENVMIEDAEIIDHNTKLKAAGRMLGPKAMVPDWQFPESNFGELMVFGPPETVGKFADFNMRMSLLYVDYIDGWKIGTNEPHYHSLEEATESLARGINNFPRA